MTTTTDVVRTEPEPGGELDSQRLRGGLASGNGVIDPARWQMLAAIAETVFSTPFVPEGLRGSKPSTLACLLYGDAMGVGPMVALKEISMIDGKPSMSAALMVAMVVKDGHVIRREEIRDADGKIVGVRAHGARGDNGAEDSFEFTIDMAARAGLLTKHNWQKYPEAMLWHRASSQLCTFLFPDVFMGSPYTPDELGVENVDPVTGAAEEAVPEALTAPQAAPEAADEPEQPQAAQEPQEAAPEVVEGEVVEAGWTPLDERAPTDDEYADAKAKLAAGGLTADEAELLETLANAYETEKLAGGGAAAAEAGKGTIPQIMEAVNAAIRRGDKPFIEGVLAHEESKPQPRLRLVESLKEQIAAMTVPEPEPEPPAEAVQPELGDTGFEQSDHDGKALFVKAAIAWLEDQQPDMTAWKYPAVIESANRIWSLNVTTVEQLPEEKLGKIWQAVPPEVRETLERTQPDQLAALAAAAGGTEAES